MEEILGNVPSIEEQPNNIPLPTQNFRRLHKIPATYTQVPPPTQNRREWWLGSVTLLLGDKDIWIVLVT